MAIPEKIRKPLRPAVHAARRLWQRLSRLVNPWRGWSGEHHPIFERFPPWEGETDGRWMIDSLGGRTDPAFRPTYRAQPAGALQTKHPEPYAPYFELAFVLEAVADVTAERPFVMVELGAGHGAWLVTALCAARRLGHPVARLIGVEMVPHHLEWMRQHLATNGADEGQLRLVAGAVGTKDGEVRYAPIEDPSADFGQRLDPAGGATVRCYRLQTLLENEPAISLIHCDIQGAELDAFSGASQLLAERVHRILISTHSRTIHRQLRRQLETIGFDVVCDFGVRGRARTPYGDVQFLDGLLCAVNRKGR